MSGFIISVGTVSFLFSIASLLLPNGKTSKIIKGVFSVVLLLVVIKPFFDINGINTGEIFSYEEDVYLDDGFFDYLFDRKNEIIESEIESVLKKSGLDDFTVEFDYEKKETLEIKNITLIFKKRVMISDKEHIDIIEEIKNVCSNRKVYVNSIEFKYV